MVVCSWFQHQKYMLARMQGLGVYRDPAWIWIYTRAACVFRPCGALHGPETHPAVTVEYSLQWACFACYAFLPHHQSIHWQWYAHAPVAQCGGNACCCSRVQIQLYIVIGYSYFMFMIWSFQVIIPSMRGSARTSCIKVDFCMDSVSFLFFCSLMQVFFLLMVCHFFPKGEASFFSSSSSWWVKFPPPPQIHVMSQLFFFCPCSESGFFFFFFFFCSHGEPSFFFFEKLPAPPPRKSNGASLRALVAQHVIPARSSFPKCSWLCNAHSLTHTCTLDFCGTFYLQKTNKQTNRIEKENRNLSAPIVDQGHQALSKDIR